MGAIGKVLGMGVLIVLFLSCCGNRENRDNSQIIGFDVENEPILSDVRLSDLGFVDIEYIPLQTSDSCIVAEINDIVFGDEYFLVHRFTDIFMFGYDGRFIRRIGAKGRGPEEFTVVHDLDIDRKSQNIYIVDGWRQKFLVYSPNGSFIRGFDSHIYSQIEFSITAKGILCYCSNQFANIENSYFLVDTSGNPIKYYPNKYPWVMGSYGTLAFLHENLIYRNGSQLFVKEVYSDTVFEYVDLNFKPYMVINHGGNLVTPEMRSENTPEYIAENSVIQNNLFEFGDFIYYEFVYKKKLSGDGDLVGLIGSRKSGNCTFFDADLGIINDLDGGPEIVPKTIIDDNTLVCWVDAITLKKHVASEEFKKSSPKYPVKKKELEKLAENLEETDNPILILLRLSE